MDDQLAQLLALCAAVVGPFSVVAGAYAAAVRFKSATEVNHAALVEALAEQGRQSEARVASLREQHERQFDSLRDDLRSVSARVDGLIGALGAFGRRHPE